MDDFKDHEYCGCCQVHVGAEDALVIIKQLKNCEKQCTWCGDDFNLNVTDAATIVESYETTPKTTLELLRDIIHKKNKDTVFTSTYGAMQTMYSLDSNLNQKQTQTRAYSKEDTPEWKAARKEAILNTFGVDTDKETFDPGYADKNGDPHDRMFDGDPYYQVDRNMLPHRMLRIVSDNPGCITNHLMKKSYTSRPQRKKRLNHSCIARLAASKLIKFTSDFMCFYSTSNPSCASMYLGKIPRFKRKFTITPKGSEFLKKLDTDKKRMYV